MDTLKNYETIINNINNMIVYKGIRNSKTVDALYTTLCSILHGKGKYEAGVLFIRTLLEEGERLKLEGNIYKKLLIKALLDDENDFSLLCERTKEIQNTSLFHFAKKDIENFYPLINLKLDFIAQKDLAVLENFHPFSANEVYSNDHIDCSVPENFVKTVVNHYAEKGCGTMASFPMFRYDSSLNALTPVENPDLYSFDRIIGYEYQKRELQKNTESFLAGYNANNVLLVGSRGTGKSTCIKSLPSMYFEKGLRIIEIKKEQITELSRILALLGKRGQHFIIFIDDLSFEEFEIEYKYMKSLLEGNTEKKPDNVLFYATSNRRHIIQEKWSDKNTNPDDEEIHTSDTINEKLSLSDRFGLTLTFSKPTPEEYLNIVKGIASSENIRIAEDELKKEAFQWELTKGISGRTARQFINHLLWEKSAAPGSDK